MGDWGHIGDQLAACIGCLIVTSTLFFLTTVVFLTLWLMK